MTGSAMSRDAADQVLAGLGAAYDRIAAAMFALDNHPGLAFLRDSGLRGGTLTRWRTLRPEVDLLWAHFTVLGEMLSRARGLRGPRRPDDAEWSALTRLLREPVVGLDQAGMPVAEGEPAAGYLHLWDLAQQLEQRCAATTVRLSEVNAAWSQVATQLAPLSGAIDTLVPLAGELGEPELGERLRAGLTAVQEEDLADPLAAAPSGQLAGAASTRLAELTEQVEAARARLAGLAALRSGYRDRIGALALLLDGLASAESAVAAAYARATEKIAEPGLPPSPDAAAILRARLPELNRMATQGRWSDLAEALATAESSVRQAAERAGQLRELATGLVARRDELRGRLEAYRAKAARHGLAEHDELTSCYVRAHDLLFLAPCDLRASTRAVHTYQETVAALIASGGQA